MTHKIEAGPSIETARATLRAARPGSGTPIVAMGWATFDPPRAWHELDLLARGEPDDAGVADLPMLATAVRAVLAAEPDNEAEITMIYPRVVAHHLWWHSTRDPNGTGLVTSTSGLAEIGTNAILLRAEQDLLRLNASYGSRTEEAEISERIVRMKSALSDLWSPAQRIYLSPDAEAATAEGFLPLYAGLTDHAAELTATFETWCADRKWPVPATNWMIAEGFTQAGQPNPATTIIEATRSLIDTTAFCESSNATTAAIRLLIER